MSEPKCYKRLKDITAEEYGHYLKTGEHPVVYLNPKPQENQIIRVEYITKKKRWWEIWK